MKPVALAEIIIAGIKNRFPKIEKIRVDMFFNPGDVKQAAEDARREIESRRMEIRSANEADLQQFCTCVACSPFAPDHVCVLTPERPPQCGRPLGQIKTGALYGYDDMSSIHHSKLHRNINSFGITDKGKCLDEKAGEWEGVNRTVRRLSHGRTTRVTLHALGNTPHTGCGCFRLIIYRLDEPETGIGIMHAAFSGKGPDGRDWRDLHYALAGKQSPGIAGASPAYLKSRRFLKGEGGWGAVTWVTGKIADIMGKDLPSHVRVG